MADDKKTRTAEATDQKVLKDLVTSISTKVGVDPNYMWALAGAESGWDPNTKPSEKGAMGLMQIMPETFEAKAQQLGLSGKLDINNTVDNILIGAHLVKDETDYFGGDMLRVTRAYNAGRKAELSGEAKAYPETVNHAMKVQELGGFHGGAPFAQPPGAGLDPASTAGTRGAVAQSADALGGELQGLDKSIEVGRARLNELSTALSEHLESGFPAFQAGEYDPKVVEKRDATKRERLGALIAGVGELVAMVGALKAGQNMDPQTRADILGSQGSSFERLRGKIEGERVEKQKREDIKGQTAFMESQRKAQSQQRKAELGLSALQQTISGVRQEVLTREEQRSAIARDLMSTQMGQVKLIDAGLLRIQDMQNDLTKHLSDLRMRADAKYQTSLTQMRDLYETQSGRFRENYSKMPPAQREAQQAQLDRLATDYADLEAAGEDIRHPYWARLAPGIVDLLKNMDRNMMAEDVLRQRRMKLMGEEDDLRIRQSPDEIERWLASLDAEEPVSPSAPTPTAAAGAEKARMTEQDVQAALADIATSKKGDAQVVAQQFQQAIDGKNKAVAAALIKRFDAVNIEDALEKARTSFVGGARPQATGLREAFITGLSVLEQKMKEKKPAGASR